MNVGRASRVSSQSDVWSSTLVMPSTVLILTEKPLSRNTSIILWFDGITWAMNTEIPWRIATPARCTSKSVPIPWP